MSRNPLDKAIALLRSKKVIALRLKISPQAVSDWALIPPERALDIELLTGGKVTAIEILQYHHKHRRRRTRTAAA